MAGSFRGGVHPDDAKALSNSSAVTVMTPPGEIVLPVRQHIGAPARVIVEKGQQVKKGQVVAESGGFVSAPIHASVSGTVKAVETRLTPLGNKALSVIVESDGLDEWAENLDIPRNISELSPEQLRNILRDSGLVGMGGAGFPTHVKLSPPADKPIDTVILNGVECEPYATCDHRLMLERPETVVEGLRIIMKILGVAKAYIGIEKNKPDAIRIMKQTVKNYPGVKVAELRVRYPQGGEKQLIYAVTGRKTPAGGLPMDIGCVVQNVGTAAGIYEAVALGRPLIQRIVTVTGNGVRTPMNVMARVGDSFARLVEFAGGYTEKASKLIMGGPMMGIAQFTDDVPVIKGTSCILILEDVFGDGARELPCISCARCVDVCPMNLLPTEIASYVEFERWDDLKGNGAMDCIECGCCSYICPAKRRLVERIKFGKMKLSEMRTQEQARKKAAEEKEQTGKA